MQTFSGKRRTNYFTERNFFKEAKNLVQSSHLVELNKKNSPLYTHEIFTDNVLLRTQRIPEQKTKIDMINHNIEKLETIRNSKWSLLDQNMNSNSRVSFTMNSQPITNSANELSSSLADHSKNSGHLQRYGASSLGRSRTANINPMYSDNSGCKETYTKLRSSHNASSDVFYHRPTITQPANQASNRNSQLYNRNIQTGASYTEKIPSTSFINHSSTKYNPVNSSKGSDLIASLKDKPKAFYKTNPISEYAHLTRVTSPNFNPQYQQAFQANENVFKRSSGACSDVYNRAHVYNFLQPPFKTSE